MGRFNATDSELCERAARGDEAAFAELYRGYRDRVYGYAYRMVGTQALAEDVTHEAFLVLIAQPERYDRERGSILTFLCAIARNHILSHLRIRGHESEEDLERVAHERRGGCDPLTTLLDDELAAEVNEAVSALPPLQREALVLREFEELSYEEIAQVTGVEVNVIKSRLYRARQSLMHRLSPYTASTGDRCHELR